MVVHGLSAERIRAAPRADVVDAELCGWLGDKVVGSGRGLIAVGWNVAAFDLPYVQRFLPRFTSHLSRRSVDLNAVCFTFGGTAGSRWKSLKKRSNGSRKNSSVAPTGTTRRLRSFAGNSSRISHAEKTDREVALPGHSTRRGEPCGLTYVHSPAQQIEMLASQSCQFAPS